ncbi:head-tail connector protein [Sphingobacterium corticis]|uniref:Head-tail connector protein n=1 Tax=Sphingobacterium corticis TaxID=1812823 RepID=A0ABW5NFS3_9SPHI
MFRVNVLNIIGDEPVSLEEVKRFCRIDQDYIGEDDLLKTLISSARSMIEQYANISLIKKRLEVFTDSTKLFWLPMSPVIEIESLVDENGDTLYLESPQAQRLKVNSHNGYVVTYQAGFGKVPADLKLAIMKQVATDYDNRENFTVSERSQVISGVELSNSAKSLVKPYNRNLWL